MLEQVAVLDCEGRDRHLAALIAAREQAGCWVKSYFVALPCPCNEPLYLLIHVIQELEFCT